MAPPSSCCVGWVVRGGVGCEACGGGAVVALPRKIAHEALKVMFNAAFHEKTVVTEPETVQLDAQ